MKLFSHEKGTCGLGVSLEVGFEVSDAQAKSQFQGPTLFLLSADLDVVLSATPPAAGHSQLPLLQQQVCSMLPCFPP